MSKKENEKGTEDKSQEAGVPVPREKTEPGKTSVVGDHNQLFENGKLREPKKSAEQLLKEAGEKDPKTAMKIQKMEKEADKKLEAAKKEKPKVEKVTIKNDKYSRIATYSVNQESADREVKLLTELEKVKDIQILPKDTASFKLKTITGNHSVGIVDTLKTSFSVKVNPLEQVKISTDAQVDDVIAKVKTEMERLAKLPSKKKTSGTKKAAPKNPIGKKELLERMDAVSEKQFHMAGSEVTKTCREYCGKKKIGIRESKDGFVFSKTD